MRHMKRLLCALLLASLAAGSAFGAALGTNARAVIPADVQQIISVDYRALRNSESGMALKTKLMPDNMKQFEQALKGMGIDPDHQVGQLTFVAYRDSRGATPMVGVAQGDFSLREFNAKMKLKKIKPEKYRLSDIYPAAAGMVISFLDENTLVFGQSAAVKGALDARDGEAPSLNSNSDMGDMIQSADSGAIWSVLDAKGTQVMMRSALGDAGSLADFEVVKKRLLGSHYSVDFTHGVDFRLTVLTSDSMTAATMASLIRAGMLFRRVGANEVERSAMDSVNIDSDSGKLVVKFQADDRRFQSLLGSELFAQTVR